MPSNEPSEDPCERGEWHTKGTTIGLPYDLISIFISLLAASPGLPKPSTYHLSFIRGSYETKLLAELVCVTTGEIRT